MFYNINVKYINIDQDITVPSNVLVCGANPNSLQGLISFLPETTNAVESQRSPFTLADADPGTQRGIRTNVPGLASGISGGGG